MAFAERENEVLKAEMEEMAMEHAEEVDRIIQFDCVSGRAGV